jgi:hypothetical protein
MSEKIKLVAGDTRPQVKVTLTDDTTGDPIDIGVGGTVALHFRATGTDVVLFTVAGTVVDSVNGVVVFSWPPGSLDLDEGMYEGEIEITFPDGTSQTVYDLLNFKLRSQVG